MTNINITRRGLLLVLSSPSGAGKSTMSKALLHDDENLSLSVSLTTRPQRPAETQGLEYHFVSEEEFEREKAAGNLLESAEVFGYFYGTPKSAVLDNLQKGKDILFDIDWQGTQQLVQAMRDDVVSIFILPPSYKILEDRLRARAQDSEDVIQQRMQKAASEISHWAEYDYIIINNDLQKSLSEAQAILQAERIKRQRLSGIGDFVKTLI